MRSLNSRLCAFTPTAKFPAKIVGNPKIKSPVLFYDPSGQYAAYRKLLTRFYGMTFYGFKGEEEQSKFFELFTHLDSNPNHPDVAYLINSMKTMMECHGIKDMKTHAINAMLRSAKLSGIFLEAGCGTGEDAEQIAHMIEGAGGKVVAVDSSKLMIDLARQNAAQQNVSYEIGDVYNLSYPDNYFSGIHADRLLVSSKNPQAVLKEVIRVTRPGSRVCFTDVDATSICLYPYGSGTQIFLDQLLRGFVNKTMGRELPSRFRLSGLEHVEVIPAISMIRSLEELEKIFKIRDTMAGAVKNGKLTQTDADDWYASLQQADRCGELLYMASFVTVVGCKPK